MNWKTALRRARRGLREDFRLYLVAISSLTVAFLCLSGALLLMANLGRVADHWGKTARLTVYLADGAQPADIEQLQMILAALPETSEVVHVSAARARAQFLEDSDVASELAGLPADIFPASLEVTLVSGTSPERAAEIAARVRSARAASDVETYRGWFDRLSTMLLAGRGLAGGLALLVLVCVIAVVGNTIRLAVAGRRQEIEVMKLCGATDGFVRGPFVVEGAFQGFLSAGLAMLLLMIAFLALRPTVDATIATMTGVHAVFLDPLWIAAVIVGGALVGAMGSAVSLRRYLAV